MEGIHGPGERLPEDEPLRLFGIWDFFLKSKTIPADALSQAQIEIPYQSTVNGSVELLPSSK